MNRKLALLTLVAVAALPVFANAADIDWKKVDAALGKTAAVTGEVHRYGLPRSDLHVTLDGVTIKPRPRAWRMGRIRTNARRSDGDGRPCFARSRNYSGDDKVA
jgi:hypothetical protein